MLSEDVGGIDFFLNEVQNKKRQDSLGLQFPVFDHALSGEVSFDGLLPEVMSLQLETIYPFAQ